MLPLSIHPTVQLIAILLAVYTAWLGVQRTRSLHFGKVAPFFRERHVVAGSFSLILMLMGAAGGFIIVSRVLKKPILFTGLHGIIGIALIPLLVIGLFTGCYIYLYPAKRKILPAMHAVNNIIIVLLSLVQMVTGINAYLSLIT